MSNTYVIEFKESISSTPSYRSTGGGLTDNLINAQFYTSSDTAKKAAEDILKYDSKYTICNLIEVNKILLGSAKDISPKPVKGGFVITCVFDDFDDRVYYVMPYKNKRDTHVRTVYNINYAELFYSRKDAEDKVEALTEKLLKITSSPSFYYEVKEV